MTVIVVAVPIAGLFGQINGALLAGFRVQPFIVTRGAALPLADNTSADVAFVIRSILPHVARSSRHMLALGDNREAPRLAGLPVGRNLSAVYGLSGALADGDGRADRGDRLGAVGDRGGGDRRPTGGVGSVGTTLVGVVLPDPIISVLTFDNGKGVIDLSSYWQTVIRGVILLVVVLLPNRFTRPRLAGAG